MTKHIFKFDVCFCSLWRHWWSSYHKPFTFKVQINPDLVCVPNLFNHYNRFLFCKVIGFLMILVAYLNFVMSFEILLSFALIRSLSFRFELGKVEICFFQLLVIRPWYLLSIFIYLVILLFMIFLCFWSALFAVLNIFFRKNQIASFFLLYLFRLIAFLKLNH